MKLRDHQRSFQLHLNHESAYLLRLWEGGIHTSAGCSLFFFVSAPRAILNWPSRQLLCARKYIVSYRMPYGM